MSSLNDLNTIELFDDIDNIVFLCDRLNNRLIQVTSYVDEVKQTWIDKRRSIEFDSNITPIIAQKVNKCNKVLLNVAEKLAVVELQTESLHSLHTSINNIVTINNDKRQLNIPLCLPTPIPSNVSMTKNESINNGIRLQRNIFPNTTRSLNLGTNSTTNTFTARNTSTLFSETIPIKPTIEQQSAFHRPLSIQDNIDIQQTKLSPQNSITSQISQYPSLSTKINSNISMNGHQQRISNSIDSYSSTLINQINITDNKVRVKMQVIPNGTIWRNADIPIVDHPSAFFVSNQDPRVTEQFNMMSIEMNNYYSKPSNTTVPLQNISIGDFCVARFSEDHLWYRARVVLNNNESVLIVYIDYGNSESKSPNEIYPLIESLTRLPAMTVACTLNEAFPSNENFWTQEATDVFNMIVKNRIVEVHFQQSVGQQWPLHFVKVLLDGQSITQHPKLSPYIMPARNEQIALHFNDKLTPMEYILYNVAVVDSDIYNNSLP
ncbi:unnamed protein product [Rotaria sp. Silwood1]|nr:unnamed protein product [Rotaria sp. Silwood1]CAF3645640.1 unnamed protein product [Rotaria sp. Silwood1]CAF3662014.1 unnamed protein product [Rotaria sp. Silwood1]CAF3681757.1 unnamed protein product [Rotaria sp. Silwood1]CAF4722018.1 unnamed protein product [Rotaria sp. Silwood1]